MPFSFRRHCLRYKSVLIRIVFAAALAGLFPATTLAADYLSLETEHFTIRYVREQEKLALAAAGVAEEAHAGIAAFLGTQPRRRIEIAIAPDRAEFRRLSGGLIPDWGIGLAIPSHRRIVITSPAAAPARINLEEIVTHEVAHVLLAMALPGQPLPRWFDEGHAMFHARQWRMGESTRILWALVARTLIPLAELTRSFPHGRTSAELAYIESYTTIQFLVKTGGPGAFQEFVRKATEYGDFEAAMIEIYGLNLQQFEMAWRVYLKDRYSWVVVLQVLLTIPGIFTVLFLAAYLRKRYRAKKKMEAWEEEERIFRL
ncbi:MAG: hypothetical protein KAW17_12130 [Candidatus Eisenbacteria sp.]|nr:hypothetical protein [Candidatus Eisenbacteria bacterium]